MLREALHEIRLRLRALIHRGRLDRDLEDELAFHLAMRASVRRHLTIAPTAGSPSAGSSTIYAEQLLTILSAKPSHGERKILKSGNIAQTAPEA